MDTFSKPHAFSLLIAVGFAAAIHWAGGLAIPQANKSLQGELDMLAHNVAHAYTLSKENKFNGLLSEVMNESLAHPDIVAILLRAPNGKVIGFSRKNNESTPQQSSQFAHSVFDPAGQSLGTVVFELEGKVSSTVDYLKRQVWALTGGGFILSFLVAFYLLNRKDQFLAQFVSSLKKVAEGNLEIRLPIPKNEEFVDVANAFNQMLEGLHERDRMRHSLGRIMDPKIAEILIKEDPKVGGLRRQTTILFCDIRNYTSLCEQLSSDELQVFLNEYWKDTVEIIMEQEGTIDKFHGDGVCVVFGAPVLHDDDPLRAVRTAWRLIQNVELLNKRREDARKMPIQIGIGIHTGEVIAGHIGSERRMDYTVVGDAVNVAARIEELNKKFGTKILISDNVYEQVEPFVQVKTLTLAHLRGHKRPILIHAIREFHETAVPLDHSIQEKKAA